MPARIDVNKIHTTRQDAEVHADPADEPHAESDPDPGSNPGRADATGPGTQKKTPRATGDTATSAGGADRASVEPKKSNGGKTVVKDSLDGGPDEVGSYADAMNELAQIVSELESDEADVDMLADRVERAAVLVAACRERLDRARHRVDVIVADLDHLETR